jgi:aspartyl/asparaginyl-tRNA synthetase
MQYEKRNGSMTLGINRIEPLNLTDPLIQGALEQTRRALLNPRLGDIMHIRTAVQQYLCNYLVSDGYVHPPVYMLAGCTDPLNHWTYPARVNYYGEETSVTQSLILQKILMVTLSSAEKVFWASPNVRMEMRINRKEYKYATEFMQVDFERRNGTYDEMLGCVSSMICGLYRYLNNNYGEILIRIRGELLPELDDPLPVFDASRVLDEISADNYDIVEQHLCTQNNMKPFMLVNMKREAYDCYDSDSERFLNYDIIVPPFKNNTYPVECLSGAERTRSLDDLAARMKELGYPMDYFAPFFELFESLSNGNRKISCAGAGFGIERLTYGLLGLSDIHEVYPFPRLAEGRIAL